MKMPLSSLFLQVWRRIFRSDPQSHESRNRRSSVFNLVRFLKAELASSAKIAVHYTLKKPMNTNTIASFSKTIACVFVLIVGAILMSGCASLGTSSASQSISIGMSKDDVIGVVGGGNARLAKKRTLITASGVKEVWILYKGPLGWGWSGNAIDSQVILEFEKGVVSAITE